MNEENFQTFEEFKNEILNSRSKLTEKTNEEIIEEMDQVIKAYEEQKRGGN